MDELLTADQISLRTLFEAGVHFGHPTRKWNPKMDSFIFTKKSKTHVIDLEKTIVQLEEARKLIVDIVGAGGECLFVGTKLQAQSTIQEAAERCESFYVKQRWLGGMLTNFNTMKTRINAIERFEARVADPDTQNNTKRELQVIATKLKKLKKFFGGLIGIEKIPAVIFIVDTEMEFNAVNEALKLGVPIVAIVDTNSDPSKINVPIPGNDDALKSIEIITKFIADSVIEGKEKFSQMQEEKAKQAKEKLLKEANDLKEAKE